MSDNIQDKIFNLCYEMALRDATLRCAYEGRLDDLRKGDDMKTVVKNYVHLIKDHPDCVDVYSVIVEVTNKAPKSKNKSGKVVEFSYGNAQKLVNMTAKYLYIATYFNDDYKDKFKNCHCPMDSLIVESLIKNILDKQKGSQALALYKQITKRDNKAWITYLRTPWSKMTVEQYKYFQVLVNMIKKNDEDALEYDYSHWHPKES